MKEILVGAIVVVFLVTVGVYFVITDHPWFALLMFPMASGVRISTKDCDDNEQAQGEGEGE